MGGDPGGPPHPRRRKGRASEPQPALPHQTWNPGRRGLRSGLVGGQPRLGGVGPASWTVSRGRCGRAREAAGVSVGRPVGPGPGVTRRPASQGSCSPAGASGGCRSGQVVFWTGGGGILLPVGRGAPGLCWGQCLLLPGEGPVRSTRVVGGGSLRLWSGGTFWPVGQLGLGRPEQAGARGQRTTACVGEMLVYPPGPAWSGLPFSSAPPPRPQALCSQDRESVEGLPKPEISVVPLGSKQSPLPAPAAQAAPPWPLWEPSFLPPAAASLPRPAAARFLPQTAQPLAPWLPGGHWPRLPPLVCCSLHGPHQGPGGIRPPKTGVPFPGFPDELGTVGGTRLEEGPAVPGVLGAGVDCSQI